MTALAGSQRQHWPPLTLDRWAMLSSAMHRRRTFQLDLRIQNANHVQRSEPIRFRAGESPDQRIPFGCGATGWFGSNRITASRGTPSSLESSLYHRRLDDGDVDLLGDGCCCQLLMASQRRRYVCFDPLLPVCADLSDGTHDRCLLGETGSFVDKPSITHVVTMP